MKPPKILAFDVFGTVVDWHGSIRREAEAMMPELDGAAFANAWRAGYKPAMHQVRTGQLPWTNIDGLHRRILDSIVGEFGLAALDEPGRDHLNRAWHRLAPWPDSVAGLTQLKRKYVITTLSNGNFSLLTEMARHAGLPWDCIISAELFGHYKPDPEAYLGAARLLDVRQQELMLVAAHPDDLRAARAVGSRTAYVKRPLEFGAGKPLPEYRQGEFDFVADDFVDLARQLRA